MIEIQDLTKYYGDRRAVGPLSASIAKGEIVGLLGLNGAGKTTTLRVLACDLLPSSGSVRIDGFDVANEPEAVRALVGYLPEAPPLYDDLSVDEYLMFAARLRGLSKGEAARRVGEVEDATLLSDVRHDLVSTLSHGYRQRVGIAQAVVHSPRLVLLDEPITGLDPVQIVEMRALVKRLRHNHTTIISSHILPEISETCDRIFVLGNGRIVASGTEAELSSRFAEGRRLTVIVRGDKKRAAQVLAAVPSVQAVEPSNGTESDPTVASFLVQSDNDVREQVCRALVGANIGILELSKSSKELESIFLRLARPNGNGAQEAS